MNNSNFLNYNGTFLGINLSMNTIINNCIFTKSYSNTGYSLYFEESIIIIKNTNIFNLNSNGIYAFGLLTNLNIYNTNFNIINGNNINNGSCLNIIFGKINICNTKFNKCSLGIFNENGSLLYVLNSS